MLSHLLVLPTWPKHGNPNNIKQQVVVGSLKGLHIWGVDLTLLHQQFFDDIMLFCQASVSESKVILDILKCFMDASGTLINNDKSNVLFFNIAPQSQRFLARTLGFSIGTMPTKYLGMTPSINSLHVSRWKNLITKIQNHFQNWSFRALNAPSHVFLLKYVLQSTPIYQLSEMATQKSSRTEHYKEKTL